MLAAHIVTGTACIQHIGTSFALQLIDCICSLLKQSRSCWSCLNTKLQVMIRVVRISWELLAVQNPCKQLRGQNMFDAVQVLCIVSMLKGLLCEHIHALPLHLRARVCYQAKSDHQQDGREFNISGQTSALIWAVAQALFFTAEIKHTHLFNDSALAWMWARLESAHVRG